MASMVQRSAIVSFDISEDEIFTFPQPSLSDSPDSGISMWSAVKKLLV